MGGSIGKFKQLQGATLLDVTVDCTSRGASLLLRAHSVVQLRVVAEGVRTVVVPLEGPSGPKSCVEHLHGPVLVGPGRSRLELALQSGDAVVIEAADFRLQVV
jgi:hypothetical protein